MSGPASAPQPTPPSGAVAHPPETLEGWYTLHQLFRVDRAMLREWAGPGVAPMQRSAESALAEVADPADGGWSALYRVVGSDADVMVVHFRPTLAAIGEAQRRLQAEELFDFLEQTYSFLSVAEAGLYHVTAQLARDAAARGGAVGDDAYRAALAERATAERESAHVRRRLYPERPAAMPWICFYPMSKRRAAGQNWYALSLDERSRLMQTHGLTGRRYAGKIQQVIGGSIGLDAWEWGVTLFAADPLEFKKIVTDMRFDEVSAKYAEFGDFYVGEFIEPGDWVASLAPPAAPPAPRPRSSKLRL